MTNDKREKVINGLNGLLEKNYDAEQGFKSAFNATDNLDLKSFFDNQVKQRLSFGNKLKSEIRGLGATPSAGGSMAGSLHRAWMDLKKAIASNDEDAILESCHRGEKAMLDEYNDVLKMDDLPNEIQSRVILQRNAIIESLREIEKYQTVYA
jgi:uncharacterized protein (TIGR02284 family)